MSLKVKCPHCQMEILPGTVKVVTRHTAMLDAVGEIAEQTGIPLAEIMAKKRHRAVVDARHLAIKLVRERFPEMSYPQLGKFFGMDHSSIMSALGALKNRPQSVQNMQEFAAGPRLNVPQPSPMLDANDDTDSQDTSLTL